jgi:chemotaxis protein MotA
MQILGLALLVFVVQYGFAERASTTVSAFDPHALVMVLGGSLSAILVSSSSMTTLRTLACLRELVPGARTIGRDTEAIEAERKKFAELWLDGKRAQAVEVAEKSAFLPVQRMLPLVIGRAPEEASRATYTELRHAELSRWQPAIGNWELLAKLGPSFGMVGTITGMVKLFQSMGSGNMDLGAAISLALVATLYGVAFGAGVAGPIGHFLRNLLDERLGALERCQQSANELIARGGRDARATG